MKLSQRIREMDFVSKVICLLSLIGVPVQLARNVFLAYSGSGTIAVFGALLIVYVLSWCRSISKNRMAAFLYGAMALACFDMLFYFFRFEWMFGNISLMRYSYLVAAMLFVVASALAARNKSYMVITLVACAFLVVPNVPMVLDDPLIVVACVGEIFVLAAAFLLSIIPNRCVGGSDVVTAEKKLNLLKEKHELGILTDEQYQAQRQEILLNM